MTFRVYFRDKFHQGVALSYRELEAESMEAAEASINALLVKYDEVVQNHQIEVDRIVLLAPTPEFEEFLENQDSIMRSHSYYTPPGMDRFFK